MKGYREGERERVRQQYLALPMVKKVLNFLLSSSDICAKVKAIIENVGFQSRKVLTTWKINAI